MQEGEGGEDALIGSNLVLQCIVLVLHIRELPLLLFLELTPSQLEDLVLVSVLVRLSAELVGLALLVLEESLEPFLGDLEFLELTCMLELDLLHFGLEVCDLAVLLHQLDLILNGERGTNSSVYYYSCMLLSDDLAFITAANNNAARPPRSCRPTARPSPFLIDS